MKTLKELNEKCVLIAEFKQPAFVGQFAHAFKRGNKAAIYYKKDTKIFYVYTYIKKALIIEYNERKNAFARFKNFISNVLYN